MSADTLLHLLAPVLTPTVLVAVLLYDVLLIAILVLLVRRFRRRRTASRSTGCHRTVPLRSGYGSAPSDIAVVTIA
jgi:hypothetical protein